jgi:hypothetical protein
LYDPFPFNLVSSNHVYSHATINIVPLVIYLLQHVVKALFKRSVACCQIGISDYLTGQAVLREYPAMDIFGGGRAKSDVFQSHIELTLLFTESKAAETKRRGPKAP